MHFFARFNTSGDEDELCMGFNSPFFVYYIITYYDTILYIHITIYIYIVLSRCPIFSYQIIHVNRPDLHWGSPNSMFHGTPVLNTARAASFALTAWPKEGPHMLVLRKIRRTSSMCKKHTREKGNERQVWSI